MPWREASRVELRRLFISVARDGKLRFAAACREFGISRKTGYKWMHRYCLGGEEGLKDRSRRPRKIRQGVDPQIVKELLKEKKAYPDWGARKLCVRLVRRGIMPPPERTANRILKRAGMVEERVKAQRDPMGFERPRPNDLWQIDHKSAIHGAWARRAVPFLVSDDHSRYLVGLRSLPDKGLESTWTALWEIFGEYGLPVAILSDNDQVFHGRVGPSRFEARLMRLGIEVLHGRPYHPQTQGKVERLGGTLQRELLRNGTFRSAEELQAAFDRFRRIYNFERPHESLGMEVPAVRYRPSPRVRPDRLPEVEYPSGVCLRSVQKDGWISWKGSCIEVGVGFHGQRVEVREVGQGIEVYYGRFRILGTTLEHHKTREQKLSGARLEGVRW